MKFGIADPPYYGCGKKRYLEHHPEAAIWDKKETHINLIKKLVKEFPDGWVLSCNPRDLVWILPHCPDDVRVGAWCKTFHQIRKTTNQFSWEPIIFRGGRKELGRKPMIRDWLSCRCAMRKGLCGAKPDEFNDWILQILNYKIGDEVVDMFPGTGGLGEAIDRYNKLGEIK